jgi:hypothetical protein
LELLLLVVPEVVLLLVIALAVVIPLGIVILVGGGVELLDLGAVGDCPTDFYVKYLSYV